MFSAKLSVSDRLCQAQSWKKHWDNFTSLNSFAAVWTVFKILIQRPFAKRTGFILITGLPWKIRVKFRDCLFTAITHDEWFAFFNSQERDKKETEVVIHPFKIGLVQTAHRAPPRVLVQYLCFGRYAGDKDHTGMLWNSEYHEIFCNFPFVKLFHYCYFKIWLQILMAIIANRRPRD